MKIKMIELEYQRSGLVEVYRVRPEFDKDDTSRYLKLLDAEHQQTFDVKRKRIAPYMLEKCVKRLTERCWSREHEDYFGAYGAENLDIILLLPPAKVLRQRTITIEFGAWIEPPIRGTDRERAKTQTGD